MNKKEKTIAAAFVGIVVLVVVIVNVVKNLSVPYTINDLYEDMEWGMSLEQVKAKAIDLGEKWNDNVVDLKDEQVYIAEGTNFDGDTYLRYKVLYHFREDKLSAVWVTVYSDDDDESATEKMYKQFLKGFDDKYPRSQTDDWDEDDFVIWESHRSAIECLRYSSHIILVYEDMDVRRKS